MPRFVRSILSAALIFGLAVSLVPSSQAQMTVDPVILAFDRPTTNRQDMMVGNVGLRTLFLEVSAARIANPGDEVETYLESPDPEQIGLIVAPRRIVLQPGEEKTVRVILLDQEIGTDAAWRVHFKPVIGDVITDSPVAIPLISVKALVFARPAAPEVNIVGRRTGRRLELTNLGNTNALLSNGTQCLDAASDCEKVSAKRLWPGMVWITDLPIDAPVSFQVRDMNRDRTIEF